MLPTRISILALGGLVSLVIVACGGGRLAPTGEDAAPTADAGAESGQEEASAGEGGPETGPTTGAKPLFVGGARLKAIFFRTPDGLEIFSRFHDSKLDVDCSFGTASDGTLRCLPRALSIIVADTFFADAACTQARPLAFANGYANAYDCPPFGYAAKMGSECEPRVHIFGVGAPPAGTTYFRDAGSCTAVDPTATVPSTGAYAVLSEVPPTDFVAAVEQPGEDLGGVLRVDLLAEDGARAFWGFRDVARGAACSFNLAADGRYRCLPDTAAFAAWGLYANSACDSPVYWAEAACGAPAAVRGTEISGCQEVTRVYDAGPLVTTVYAKSNGQCLASAAGTGQASYARGKEIDPSGFVEGPASPAGPTRIQARGVTFGGVTYPYSSGGFTYYDTQLQSDCYFELASDQVTRCIPSSNAADAVVMGFSDDACTKPVVSEFPRAGCNATFTNAWWDGDTTCPHRVHVYGIGAETTPTSMYYTDVTGACSAGSPPADGVSHAPGPELDPASFAGTTIAER